MLQTSKSTVYSLYYGDYALRLWSRHWHTTQLCLVLAVLECAMVYMCYGCGAKSCTPMSVDCFMGASPGGGLWRHWRTLWDWNAFVRQHAAWCHALLPLPVDTLRSLFLVGVNLLGINFSKFKRTCSFYYFVLSSIDTRQWSQANSLLQSL